MTESLDEDANVIWGARIDEDMKGKVTVMTIITGVKSPWILGKMDAKAQAAETATLMNEELGIKIMDR